MDKRQQKTQQAILKALRKLLREKPYAAITISEIIERANIGRSTFYAHFETKDAIMHAVCANIFDALLVHTKSDQAKEQELQQRIVAIFQHMKMNEDVIGDILRSEGENIFMQLLQEHIFALFTQYHILLPPQVPEEYGKYHFAQSFCTALTWWLTKASEQSAEDMTEYFMTLLQLKQRGIALTLL